MKRESKIVKAAKLAKELGYDHISTVVKSVFATTYHNHNSVEDILQHGKWVAAQYHNGRWCGPMGTSYKDLPPKTISRVDLFRKLDAQ